MISDSRLKFEEHCNYVIDLKEPRGIKHSTIVRYKELAVRIYPAIGHIKLKDLRADHLNSFYTDLTKPGQNKRTGEGLSPKTILEHRRLISTVLDQAEREGLVPFNVAAKATLPKVSKRHDLPHINPHAFRHTMVSMLYFSGVDSVSISKRLGHAQVSTTANIYAHVMESADRKNADILANVFLKKA